MNSKQRKIIRNGINEMLRPKESMVSIIPDFDKQFQPTFKIEICFTNADLTNVVGAFHTMANKTLTEKFDNQELERGLTFTEKTQTLPKWFTDWVAESRDNPFLEDDADRYLVDHIMRRLVDGHRDWLADRWREAVSYVLESGDGTDEQKVSPKSTSSKED